MYDYPTQIEDFIKENFEHSTPELANFKLTTQELLNFLFSVFPVDCISDYDLNDILLKLGYNRFTFVFEFKEVFFENKNEKIRISKSLKIGWCFKSHHDLTEIVKPVSI